MSKKIKLIPIMLITGVGAALLMLAGTSYATPKNTYAQTYIQVLDAPIVLAAQSKSRAFPAKRSATGRNVFIFDPRRLRWAAYNSNGTLIKTGAGSGGKGYCSDLKRSCRTPSGTYSVYAKRGASCKSSKFPVGKGGAPMPYCTFFRGGYAIHGSYNVPNYNASHGCIRVHPSAAKWLQKFLHYGATVIVRSY